MTQFLKMLVTGSSPLALVFACVLTLSHGVAIEEVHEIPNPRSINRWVTDLTGTVSPQDLDRVNEFCESIHQTNGTEMAVVVIRTTGGKLIEDFAVELFNLWGIGNTASDDGLLFLVAKEDRKMRIALGDGIDGSREESIAQQILDDEVKPRFRAGEFGEGLYSGTFSTAIKILNLGEQEITDTFPSPAAVAVTAPANIAPQNVRQGNQQRDRRGGGFAVFPLVVAGGLLGLLGLAFFGGRHWLRYRRRHCPACGREMVLLEEDVDDRFLEKPEQTEERIGSVDYDVWACLQCEDVAKVRYGKFFTRYGRCPQCSYKTKLKVEKTILAATTTHGGRVHVQERCVNCSYHHESYYSTPMISDDSSNGSGSSSFSGGSSSGFGGGSSSGGGATSSW